MRANYRCVVIIRVRQLRGACSRSNCVVVVQLCGRLLVILIELHQCCQSTSVLIGIL